MGQYSDWYSCILIAGKGTGAVAIGCNSTLCLIKVLSEALNPTGNLSFSQLLGGASLHHRYSCRRGKRSPKQEVRAGEEAEAIQWHRSRSPLKSAEALQGQRLGRACLGTASSLGNPVVFSDACIKRALSFLFWVCWFKQCP